MATMRWPDVIGDDRYTKRYIDERDGSGNQLYIGKAPVVDASVNDDGWFIRRQWFDASNRLVGYQEFTGIWSKRATYIFGPATTVTVNPMRLTSSIVVTAKKFDYGKVYGRLQLAARVRPMPVAYLKAFGQVRVRSVIAPGKNWSTVPTRVRRAIATCGVVYGRGRAFKIKIRKTATVLRMSAKVVATK
jgi:hypothetical protein